MAKDPRRKGMPRRPSRQFLDAIAEVAADDLIAAWPGVDWGEVFRVASGWYVLSGATEDDPALIVMLCPAITDQMEFDRRVCAAGLTDYIRETMPEDRGAGCTPVDPETGRPDPSREAFEHDPGPYVRVRQVAPGFRIKRGWRVAILTEPRKPA